MLQEGLPDDLEARESNQWWKAKKWALHVVNRLAGRYGDPKTLKDTKVDRPFAEMWKTQCSFKFLDAILAMMANFSNVRTPGPLHPPIGDSCNLDEHCSKEGCKRRYEDPKIIKHTKQGPPCAKMWKTQGSFKFLDAILAMMASFSNVRTRGAPCV
jgi:hypothetical protein